MSPVRERACGPILTLLILAWASTHASARAQDEGSDPESESSSESTTEAPSPEESTAPPAPTAPAALPHAGLSVGAGVTQRDITFSSADARRSLKTGLVPALAIELDATFGQQWFCAVKLAYRSSVFAKGSQIAPDASTTALTSTIQTHEFVGGVEPGVHFGGEYSPSLALFAGYGVRALSSVIELVIPRFSLHGPVARVALDIPWSDGRFGLRLAPEAQWIVSQTLALRETARTERQGFAYGLEASLRAEIVSWLGLQVLYRESRAHIASAWPTAFEDVERFILLNARIAYN